MTAPSVGAFEGATESRVVIVVPNWNGRGYLETCLQAVFAQEYEAFVVVVVDNGSTDGSVELVRAAFPQVRLIRNRENRGFAAATNQGISASDSEFIATLNNDTEVHREWLGALVRAMESDPRVGMCASKMMLAGREETVDSAGIAVDRAGIAWELTGGDASGETTATQCEVFGPSAGAALYRRAMLDDIGLFDEDFFAYLEDVDLAWRAQWAGWRCLYVPQAVARHVHSATGGQVRGLKGRLLGRSKLWMVCKNYPWPAALLYAPLIVAYDLMAIGYAIAVERRAGALRGRLEAVGGIGRMVAKRRRMVRRISAASMLAKLSPLVYPWRIPRRYAHVPSGGGRGRGD